MTTTFKIDFYFSTFSSSRFRLSFFFLILEQFLFDFFHFDYFSLLINTNERAGL